MNASTVPARKNAVVIAGIDAASLAIAIKATRTPVNVLKYVWIARSEPHCGLLSGPQNMTGVGYPLELNHHIQAYPVIDGGRVADTMYATPSRASVVMRFEYHNKRRKTHTVRI